MIYLVLLVVAILAWGIVRVVPTRDPLLRTGIALVVVGALTTLVMWWMVIPELVLAAGVGTLAFGWFRPRPHGA